MSIKLYNQTQTNPLSGYGLHDKENDRFNLEPGHILNATVSYKDGNRTTLTTKDQFTFEVSSASVKGEVGDELKFQVVKGGKGNLALKQLIDQPEELSKASGKNGAFGKLIEIFKQNSLIRETDTENPVVDQETQAKTTEAVAKIKRQMAYASDNMSQSAMQELIRSGVSLQKISLNVLNTVSHEIEKKPDREISKSELAKRASELGTTELSSEDARRIVKALYDHGLPERERNVAALQNVLAIADKMKTVSPAAAAKLIGDEKPVTLENMYIYEFSTKGIRVAAELTSDQWNEMKPQVDRVFDREGIERTDEVYEAARFLLKNDLPVNKENIEKAKFLLSPDQTIDREEILDRAAANLADGKRYLEIGMMESPSVKDRDNLIRHYRTVMTELSLVTADTVDSLMKRQLPLTIQNLRGAQEEQRRANSQYSAVGEDISVTTVSEASSASAVTAKRRLAEIQLKLTREAAVRLAGKGINIDTMPLEKAVEELRTVEREGYASKLRMTGGESSAENVGRMASLFDRVAALQPLTSRVFGDILTKKIEFSIEGMFRSKRVAQTMDDWETFATAPSRRHGDSFGKVREQFGSLLDGLGIETTEGNLRAAVILSRSRIDINQDNIDRTKLIDEKVDAIANRLHPTIAASMISEGLDPAEMHVDEVLAYINRFNDLYGHDLKDKIASHIMAMDNNKDIGTDDREKLIAVYRMLNLIQRNDSAAVGVAIKANASLTLGGLMESGKYYQRTHAAQSRYDLSIDDEFGRLSELTISESKISRILAKDYQDAYEKLPPAEREEAERVFEEENMGQTEKNLSLFSQAGETGQGIAGLSYQLHMLDSFTGSADPAALQKLMDEGIDLFDTSMEELAQRVRDLNHARGAAEPEQWETQRHMRQLQELVQASPQTVQDMASNRIPMTLPFIGAYQSMVKNPFHLGDQLEELSEEQPEIDLDSEIMGTDLEELKAGEMPEDLLNRLHDKVEEIKDNTYSEKLLTQLDLIQNAVKVQCFVDRSRSGFSLPIKLHDKITNLNMLVLNDNLSEAGKIFLSLDTGRMGKVQAYLTMENGEATLEISTDQPDGLEALRENAAVLEGYLREAGVKTTTIRFGTEEKTSAIHTGVRPHRVI